MSGVIIFNLGRNCTRYSGLKRSAPITLGREWSFIISVHGLLQLSQTQPLLAVLSEDEREQMTSVVRRAETLAQCAQERGVRLMVDAEQTYYQPAIRHVAVNVLMPKYNMARPVIYNTQQCYLKVNMDWLPYRPAVFVWAICACMILYVCVFCLAGCIEWYPARPGCS